MGSKCLYVVGIKPVVVSVLDKVPGLCVIEFIWHGGIEEGRVDVFDLERQPSSISGSVGKEFTFIA